MSSSNRLHQRLGLGGVAFLALAALASPAFAEGMAAFDIDYAAPIDSEGVASGYGFGVRLGGPIHAPLIVLTPELGFTYHRFSGVANQVAYGGIAGVRLGIGEVIRPGAFAHIGYGARSTELPGRADDSGALTYDVGAFLDLTLLPVLDLGVHGGYDSWTGGSQPSFPFVTVGAHVAVIF